VIRRALLSVWDKAGLAELGQALAERGIEMISTGGTARTLLAAGLSVRTVEDVTGFPEILGGRVKTLHPAIHGGILARREPGHLAELETLSLAPIDLVVVNLYPFTETVARPNCSLEDAIEQIDIGGVALLRAAAKNFASVVVLSDPADYPCVIDALDKEDSISSEERQALALKAFARTAAYDTAIQTYLSRLGSVEEFPPRLDMSLEKVSDLRYGENPHQEAAFYRLAGTAAGLPDARLRHGKALSFNNLLDLDAAWNMSLSFSGPTVTIIKHGNPCGLACANTLSEAYQSALACDPVSAFGSVIGCNVPVDDVTAGAMTDLFVEAVIAPGYSEAALKILQQKTNIRLLERPTAEEREANWLANVDMRRVRGGVLLQGADRFESESDWKVVTDREPTEAERESLEFAWRVVARVKSNAIVLARGTATVGIGAGQMSRVDSTELAIKKAGPERCRGTVMASDAFFPFPDSVERAAAVGVTAVIEPGSSVRDEEVIAAANNFGVAMIFTGSRHFLH
jgi:phosphoribosylaminoimidazolecarboxamide formyltransferase/IMP cyclohydrolase